MLPFGGGLIENWRSLMNLVEISGQVQERDCWNLEEGEDEPWITSFMTSALLFNSHGFHAASTKVYFKNNAYDCWIVFVWENDLVHLIL